MKKYQMKNEKFSSKSFFYLFFKLIEFNLKLLSSRKKSLIDFIKFTLTASNNRFRYFFILKASPNIISNDSAWIKTFLKKEAFKIATKRPRISKEIKVF